MLEFSMNVGLSGGLTEKPEGHASEREIRVNKKVRVSLPGSRHSSPSADDPQETDDVFIGNGGFLITNLPATRP
jgi:hypothetical protein